MSERVRVWVQRFADREALQLQWICPASGRRRTRSAKTADPDRAERARSDLEYELNHGLHRETAHVSWERFRECFEAEYYPGIRADTRRVYRVTLNHFERICTPSGLAGITARTVSAFVAGLRKLPGRGPGGKDGVQASTLAVRLQFLRTVLGWAVAQGMLAAVPAFPAVKVPRRRPQPVAAEAFERLLAKATDPELRAFCLCGWLAGLRLNEARCLSWEPGEAPWVDFARSRIWLPAGFTKSVEDQWVPVAPELRDALAELARTGPNRTELDQANGRVFPWDGRDGQPLSREATCDRVRRLARRAGVRLTMRSLRRGFACRHAARVPAQVLQRLLRHASITTTMAHYSNVDAAAEEAILGPGCNNPRNTPEPAARPTVEIPEDRR
jgi:integrase